jgi:hypothetical protein
LPERSSADLFSPVRSLPELRLLPGLHLRLQRVPRSHLQPEPLC